MDWSYFVFAFLAVIIVVFTIQRMAAWQFRMRYINDVSSALNSRNDNEFALLTESDIRELPDPVQRYLRYTGCLGKPKVFNFRIEFEGKIRGHGDAGWMPLTSEQYNFLEVPGRHFFMKATMKHLSVDGYHCYENGDAYMDIRLLSLLRVQYQHTPEMGIAETVTFFNDMCCMAPATLIDKRIKWLATEGNRVQAEFTTNGITISAWLQFNDKGELENFISGDRYALEHDGSMKRLEWSTPLGDYKEISGTKLAGYAEAVYKYPEGNFSYGVFMLKNISYNCT